MALYKSCIIIIIIIIIAIVYWPVYGTGCANENNSLENLGGTVQCRNEIKPNFRILYTSVLST